MLAKVCSAAVNGIEASPAKRQNRRGGKKAISHQSMFLKPFQFLPKPPARLRGHSLTQPLRHSS
jgi:hypothetical protein